MLTFSCLNYLLLFRVSNIPSYGGFIAAKELRFSTHRPTGASEQYWFNVEFQHIRIGSSVYETFDRPRGIVYLWPQASVDYSTRCTWQI